jgi:predicted nucleotidyltransferase
MSSDEEFVVRVLEALADAKLESLIVGNVAAILQGAPVTTQDLDLLVRDTPRNRAKISQFGSSLGGEPKEISPLTSTLRIEASSGTIDILFDEISGGLSFESLRSRAVRIKIGAYTAKMASLEDVIASKAAANRLKDQAMLPILRDTLRVKQALAATAARGRRPAR